MCAKKTKASQMMSSLHLLSSLRKLGPVDRRAVLNHLNKEGVHTIRTCLANCIDKETCSDHLAEMLKTHVAGHKQSLLYLSDFSKVRPNKVNRAKISQLSDTVGLDPLLDVSIVGMSQQIAALAKRAAKAKFTAEKKKVASK